MTIFVYLTAKMQSYHGLRRMRGMGAQVKNTVTNRKERLPHTSDKAPIRGALMKERRPWREDMESRFIISFAPGILMTKSIDSNG